MAVIQGYHYFIHEDEDTTHPPIILIHGAGGNHLSWPPQTRRMAGRVYALDLPGHGMSDGSGMYSIGEYANVVDEFMQALGIDRAVIAGHSMGSAIALTLALRNPQLVLGLVLIGSGPKLRVSPSIMEGVSNANTFLSTVEMINDLSFSPDVPPRLKELATQRMAETRLPVLNNDFLACEAFDVEQELGKINIPVLIICGSRDRMTPLRCSRALREGIPNSRLEVIDRAGHMTMLEEPHIVTELISRFLDEFPPLARP